MALQPLRQSPTPPRRTSSQENVLDRIGEMDFDPDEGLNFLFYGESGSGKTTLWSSFPGPILTVICSGGQKPGELRSINTPEMKAKIDTVTLRHPLELDQIATAVSTGSIKHKRTGKPYACVVLDHVSGFQDLKVMHYKGLSSIPQQKSFGMATKQDWGDIAAQVKEHLIKLLSLRCNVVVIGQEKIFLPNADDPAGGIKRSIELSDVIKPKVGAALIPSLTSWLNPACDYVVQTFKRPRQVEEEQVTKVSGKEHREIVTRRAEGIQYCARVGPHEIFMTKFRVPDLAPPDAIILGDSVNGVQKNPSGYQQIMALIEGKKVKGIRV